ncbi:MAG TPA: hypothetical protein VMW84_02325 [Acidobacteriota bacterium]|nr:hypothetical protein [Acidobacteriota bacterium]
MQSLFSEFWDITQVSINLFIWKNQIISIVLQLQLQKKSSYVRRKVLKRLGILLNGKKNAIGNA